MCSTLNFNLHLKDWILERNVQLSFDHPVVFKNNRKLPTNSFLFFFMLQKYSRPNSSPCPPSCPLKIQIHQLNNQLNIRAGKTKHIESLSNRLITTWKYYPCTQVTNTRVQEERTKRPVNDSLLHQVHRIGTFFILQNTPVKTGRLQHSSGFGN